MGFLFLLLRFVAAPHVAAQDVAPEFGEDTKFGKLKAAYEEQRGLRIAAQRERIKEVQKRYMITLEQLKDVYQQRGVLDHVLVCRKEEERFLQETNFRPEDASGYPPELVKLLEQSQAGLAASGRQHRTDMYTLNKMYLGHLEQLVTVLTKEANIDEAVAAKEEQGLILEKVQQAEQRFARGSGSKPHALHGCASDETQALRDRVAQQHRAQQLQRPNPER